MRRAASLATAAAVAYSLGDNSTYNYAEGWTSWLQASKETNDTVPLRSTAGRNTSRRLMIWGGPGFGRKPREVNNISDIVTAAVSDNLCAAVTKDGDVFAIVPALTSTTVTPAPRQKTNKDSIDVLTGAGMDSGNECSAMRLKTNIGKATDVAILADSSEIVVVDAKGRVSVMRAKSSVSHEEKESIYEPGEILGGILRDANILRVRCGSKHCVAIARDGKAFAWGDNSSGQLGTFVSDLRDSKEIPKNKTQCLPLPSGVRVVDADCGEEHTVLLSQEGHLYACGSDRWAQQCVTAEPWISDNALPRGELLRAACLEDLSFQSVACGAYHTVALVKDGIPFSAGLNMHGQLGHHNMSSFAPANPIANILLRAKMVKCGRNHTCLLSDDGNVFCIGDGRSGQLGTGPRQRSAVWRQVKRVMKEEGASVVDIFAGGDTSAAIVSRS